MPALRLTRYELADRIFHGDLCLCALPLDSMSKRAGTGILAICGLPGFVGISYTSLYLYFLAPFQIRCMLSVCLRLSAPMLLSSFLSLHQRLPAAVDFAALDLIALGLADLYSELRTVAEFD